ncbi:iron uptake transporter permease EfeU [Rothia sp. (in: high G+C Gram-positive bacteria)]|uniref:iron uptake transporter permease EfeU n=1 Tax=Rothia sp. (in: high G+C Gram-positive bacteria) TaxID=1885016 RepID=UPI000ED7AC17|nr:high-affinity Fe2+/Pb2+ permease [Rothia sp. (in: high G+C Gram-positive bacteria)]
MFQNFLIGLREGLEAALVVGLLLAYVRKTGKAHLVPKIWMGVLAAVGVSLGFGALLTFGPRGLTFEAQEAIGGSLSIIAVGFVTWMIFWMAENSKHLSRELGQKIDAAQASTAAVVVIAALAVGREGLETALFLWAASQSAGSGAMALVGALLGIIIAIALAWLIMRGVLKLNLATFFRYTGIFLIFIAAGVLAYGVHDLQEAGLLPGLHHLAFDLSHIIAPTSLVGTLLKGLFNFSPATTWLEAGAWLMYTGTVLTIFLTKHKAPKTAAKLTTAP